MSWSSRVVQQMTLMCIDAHRLSELLDITEVRVIRHTIEPFLLLTESHRTLKPPFIILSFNTGPACSSQSSIKHYSRAGEDLSRGAPSVTAWTHHTAGAAFLKRCVLRHNIPLANMDILKKYGWMDRFIYNIWQSNN